MYTTYYNDSMVSGGAIFGIIALIASIAAAIVIYIVFMPKENEKKYEGFAKKLYDFLHFKNLYIVDFLKITYIFFAIFITIYSFGLISTSVGAFFGLLIVGNIVLRFAYEAILVFYRMYQNTEEIKNKM